MDNRRKEEEVMKEVLLEILLFMQQHCYRGLEMLSRYNYLEAVALSHVFMCYSIVG